MWRKKYKNLERQKMETQNNIINVKVKINNCTLKPIFKEILEKLVLNAIIKELNKKENINCIIKTLLNLQKKNMTINSSLSILLKEEKQTEQALNNIVSAIEKRNDF